MKLTEKQKAFADAYIETGNQTEAARRAGYKDPNANAARLMVNDGISAYIKDRLSALEAQRVASADEVMRFFSSVMRGEVKDQFGLDPSLSDRLNAGKELMKRYSAVSTKQEKNAGIVDSIIKAVEKVE